MTEEKNKFTACYNSNVQTLTSETKDAVNSSPNLYKHTTWPLHPDNALLDDGSIIGLDLCICKAETSHDSDDESCDACSGGPTIKKMEQEKWAELCERLKSKRVPSAKYEKKESAMKKTTK